MKSQVLLSICLSASMAFAQKEGELEQQSGLVSEKRMQERQRNGDRSPQVRGSSVHRDTFKLLDKNGDGMISSEEFYQSPRMQRLPQEKREVIFSRIDTDADGRITPPEIRKMRQESHERHMQELRKLDEDRSGGLSFSELSKGEFFSKLPDEKRKEIFDRMDTNRDGQLTPDDKPREPRGPRSESGGREHGESFRNRKHKDEAAGELD
jgi:Ca2+-binding EF-hand superfamily protein